MMACLSSSARYSALSSFDSWSGKTASARSRHVAMKPRKLLLPARSPSWRSILRSSARYSSGSGSPSSKRWAGRLTVHVSRGRGSPCAYARRQNGHSSVRPPRSASSISRISRATPCASVIGSRSIALLRRREARGIELPRALPLVAARAPEQAGGIQVELAAHELLRHVGQQLVAHVAHHAPAPGAEQPVVRAVRGGLVERDADRVVGRADLVQDRHDSRIVAPSVRRAATRLGNSLSLRGRPAAGKRGRTRRRPLRCMAPLLYV